MIIIMKPEAPREELEKIIAQASSYEGITPKPVHGEGQSIIGLVGDTRLVPEHAFEKNPYVQHVQRVSSKYKLVANVPGHDNVRVKVNGFEIGGGDLVMMIGPCAVEDREQIMTAARLVSELPRGNHITGYVLRGGAFKPRTNPHDFQGTGLEGVKWMREAGTQYDLPIVTEVVDPRHIEKLYSLGVNVFQVGARNSQNFELLKELGHQDRPVLLKRAMSGSIDELLGAAEYVVEKGNKNVILCLRGIKGIDMTYTRNVVDVGDVSVVQKKTCLPVVYDPSHSSGARDLVLDIALQAIVGGADGLLVDMHPNPEHAKCDGPQSLYPKQAFGLARAANTAKQMYNAAREQYCRGEDAK